MKPRFAAALAASLIGSAGALANPETNTNRIEETLVTAQKRAQSAQDVGIAISHFSAAELRQRQITSSVELTRATTGLMVGTPVGEGNNPNFVLRGVSMNDYADANESPVAVYVDGVYNASLAGLSFQLFDLQRVEVLRGPQGTLFGRNASGGLIHYISQPPGEQLELQTRLGIGEHQQRQFELIANSPLGERAAARISYASERHDGTIKNSLATGDGNDADSQALRAQLKLNPGERLEALLKLHANRADSNGPRYSHRASTSDGQRNYRLPYGATDGFGYADSDADPWSVAQDLPNALRIEQHGASATLRWQRDNLELVSISEWSGLNKRYYEDVDAGPLPILHANYHTDGEQLSQELRLQSHGEQTAISAGLYFFQHDLESWQRADASAFAILDMQAHWDQRTESRALFAQIEHSFSPTWRAVGGLRYTQEEKDFSQRLVDPVAAGGWTEVNFSAGQPGFKRLDEDYLSGKLQLEWLPRDNQLLYLSHSRGVKGGGFNAGFLFGLPNEQIPFQRENLNSIEAGYKSEWLDGRYQLNAAVFHYQYENFQSFQLIGIGQSVFNADARNRGAELELRGQPDRHWQFSLGLSLLDTRVDDIQSAGISREREMVFAPELSANALLAYRWLLPGGELQLQGDIDYVGEHYFDIFNNPSMREPGRAVSNASLHYRRNSADWEASLWVKNLTDKQYRAYSLDFTDFGYLADMRAPERWIGASLSYHWQ